MIRNVTPTDAQELIDKEGYRYLDVRTEEEFAAGHAACAVNVPVVFGGMVPNAEFLDVVEASFDRATPIVVGCKSGGRSMRAAQILTSAGFVTVVNMDGGFSGRFSPMEGLVQPGWEQLGLPVSSSTGDDNSYASLRSKRA